jgi:hypothetical protein
MRTQYHAQPSAGGVDAWNVARLIELFAREVMPEISERHEARERAKVARLSRSSQP